MAPDVSIVIASYNSPDVLASCLRSVATHTREVTYECIVVDNASRENNVALIKSEFPEVVLIKNSVNRGFAGACNQGIVASTGDFILLLNPDTELKDDAVSAMVAFLRGRHDAGIAGCRLNYANGQPQISVGVFPNVLDSFLQATFLSHLLPANVLVGRNGCTRVDGTAAIPVDWATGAFLLFRKEVVEAIGPLDEQFFMYTEEMDFCYRAQRAGIRIWYVPQVTVIHHWGGMSSVSRRGLLWLLASQILFLKKHYHGVKRGLLIGAKYLGLIIRAPVYLLAGLLTFNRSRLRKVGYVLYVVARLLTQPWGYQKDLTGPVTPWTEIW